MASRAVVLEQPRVGGGKEKNGQADGRNNRRVLRDIGNFVIAPAVNGKPLNQTTRPITKEEEEEEYTVIYKEELMNRSFGAQLLANAQASSMNGLVGEVGVLLENKSTVPQTKEEYPKPKNDEASIHPHKEETYKSEKKLREFGGSFKKPNKTLTSILTARSKAACGALEKPKDLIIDIDAADMDNELAAVEYVEDIYNFYKLTEDDGRVHEYMVSQKQINPKMRAILVDWLIEVHKKFELTPESLYLTVNIIDRFLSVKTVPRRELQLVGISSMLIACKYEEIWAPEVSDFIAISDNAYVREQVLLMEKAILGKLEWYLTVPTPYVFLVRYIKASIPADKEV
ncbi:hypothetical protein OROGR_019692 [Orobanche gracilis]